MIARPPVTPGNRAQADPDAQLMLRAGQGDEAAFDELVARYYGRVLAVVEHLMGGSYWSEDLAQEVFLRVYRARVSYVPDSRFSTWLFVIVNNVVRNARRTLSRRREVLSAQPEAAQALVESAPRGPAAGDPADETVRRELQHTVHAAVANLNPRQQTAIRLYHFRGLSYAELAASMDTTPCAAKALLHRARHRLRTELQSYLTSN